MASPFPGWAARVIALDGLLPRELHDELVAMGEEALPVLVEVFARADAERELRAVAVHAASMLGAIGSARAVPALVGALVGPREEGPLQREAAWALSALGTSAFPPLERLMAEPEAEDWRRLRAARVLALAAARNRLLRDRVRQAYEKLLLDPRQANRAVVSGVIDLACQLAMAVLVPAMREAHSAGRTHPDWGTPEQIELDVIARHHRVDEALKREAGRDPRSACLPLASILETLDPETRARVESALAAMDRDG